MMAMKDPLRVWAIATQLIGFVLIISIDTWAGHGEARSLQAWVLAGMLSAALVIAGLRRWRQRRELRRQHQASR